MALAGAGQAFLAASLGTYDPATGTCATYCHGATLVTTAGATPAPPSWGGPTPACLDGCHGLPPATVNGGTAAHPAVTPPDATGCWVCHTTVLSNGTIDLSTGLHIDGKVELDVAP